MFNTTLPNDAKHGNGSCAGKEQEGGGCAVSGDTGIRHRMARKYH